MTGASRSGGASDEAKKEILSLFNDSPFYRYMGMEVIEAGEGHSRLKLPVKKEFRNVYGATHGGAIATLLDSSGTIAVGSLMGSDEVAVTIDQRINYISSVTEGILYGEGKALHKGRFTGVAQVEARDEDGNLVAVGIVTIFFIRKQESKICDPKDFVDERIGGQSRHWD